MEVRRYLTRAGKDVFGEWLAGLKDVQAQARIIARIDRLSAGSFGDCKSLGGGLYELRVHWGPGYRVYFAHAGEDCVLLPCGGDKRRQSFDIRRALDFLEDYRERTI